MTVVPKKKLTVAEYLAIEEKAEVKSEFYYGEMFAMAGASPFHNVIVSNLMMLLSRDLFGSPCRPLVIDQRLAVDEAGLFTYPDILVVCGAREYAAVDPNSLTNPRVIIEVFSPSTERYDRTTKLRNYLRLPSLREYVLVAQSQPEVVHLFRREDFWAIEVLAEMPETLAFTSIDARMTLTEIYFEVEFPPPEPLR